MKKSYTFESDIPDFIVKLATDIMCKEEAEGFYKASALCNGLRDESGKVFSSIIFTVVNYWCDKNNVPYIDFVNEHLANREIVKTAQLINSVVNECLSKESDNT